jgi:phage-related tail protein
MASKNAATVTIAIEAQTATLKKGFDDAKQAIGGLQKSISGSVMSGMAKFHAGLLAIQAVLRTFSGLINGVSQSMQEMGRHTDIADRLGIAQDSLATFELAAGQVGASSDAVVTALERMKNAVAEAAQGTGTGAKALGELGLSVQKLMAMAPDEQFVAIADALQGVQSQSDFTRLSMDLFGRGAGQLALLLRGGSEGMNDFSQMANDLGMHLGNARNKVDAAGDAISRMSQAWQGLWNQFTVFIEPAISRVVDVLTRLFSILNKSAAGFTGARGEAKKYADTITKVSIADPAATAAAEKAREEMAKAEEQMRSRAESITNSLKTPAENMKDEVAELNEMVKAGAISWGTYHRGIRRAVEELFKGKQAIKEWSTPGIGAVTRSSAEGFSALQEAKRQREDDERRHREEVEWLARIEAAVKASTIELVPVKI